MLAVKFFRLSSKQFYDTDGSFEIMCHKFGAELQQV
jgi:hypothetical protein